MMINVIVMISFMVSALFDFMGMMGRVPKPEAKEKEVEVVACGGGGVSGGVHDVHATTHGRQLSYISRVAY